MTLSFLPALKLAVRFGFLWYVLKGGDVDPGSFRKANQKSPKGLKRRWGVIRISRDFLEVAVSCWPPLPEAQPPRKISVWEAGCAFEQPFRMPSLLSLLVWLFPCEGPLGHLHNLMMAVKLQEAKPC